MDRMEFQRKHCATTEGKILNIGSKEDPAGLKANYGSRVINCDISKFDTDSGHELNVDVIMDCRRDWPFVGNYAELVVMAEILEHLYVLEGTWALVEARRVAPKLILTLPYDWTLPLDYKGPEVWTHPSGARGHCTGWHEELLRQTFKEVGYEVMEWLTVDYGMMGSERLDGFLIYCERSKQNSSL